MNSKNTGQIQKRIKSIRAFLLLLLLMANASALATNKVFFVYGTVKIIQKKLASKLLVGTAINDDDSLAIENASGVIINSSLKGFVFYKKSGKNSIRDIVNSANLIKSGDIVESFMAAFESMTSNEHPEKLRASMQEIGAATRGLCPCYMFDNLDTIYCTVSSAFPLSWRRNYKVQTLRLAVYDENDERVIFRTVNESPYPIRLLLDSMKAGCSYSWSFYDGSNNCEKHFIRVLKKKERDSVVAYYLAAAKPFFSRNSDLFFFTGYLLEKHHFFGDALTYYQMAAKNDKENLLYSTTVSLYKKQYEIK